MGPVETDRPRGGGAGRAARHSRGDRASAHRPHAPAPVTPQSQAKKPAIRLEGLQRQLGYHFRRPQLCELALTHRSWNTRHSPLTDNERLEFLGDSILGIVVAQWLYQQHPKWSEGELTRGKSQLVSEVGLVPVAKTLKIGALLRVGRSQGLDPVPPSVLASTVEAILGAVLLDGGYQAADRVIRRLWQPYVGGAQPAHEPEDFKSRLQEWCLKRLRVLPHYAVAGETGPAHEREFEIVAKIKGRVYGQARGRSKKEAEQLAAREAWERLQQEHVRDGQSQEGPTHGEGKNESESKNEGEGHSQDPNKVRRSHQGQA